MYVNQLNVVHMLIISILITTIYQNEHIIVLDM